MKPCPAHLSLTFCNVSTDKRGLRAVYGRFLKNDEAENKLTAGQSTSHTNMIFSLQPMVSTCRIHAAAPTLLHSTFQRTGRGSHVSAGRDSGSRGGLVDKAGMQGFMKIEIEELFMYTLGLMFVQNDETVYIYS